MAQQTRGQGVWQRQQEVKPVRLGFIEESGIYPKGSEESVLGF